LNNVETRSLFVQNNYPRPLPGYSSKFDNYLVWLRIPRINLTDAFDCIIKAFQNPIWAEQARERLKQIQTLTKTAVA